MVLQFFYLVAIGIVPGVCRVHKSTALHPYAIHDPLHLLKRVMWFVLLSKQVQSTLIILKSKGSSKILQDICTSTY